MKKPTILIVDDEPDLREAIAFDFRRSDFHVLTAGSGTEAFRILGEHQIDVVLSDVAMASGGASNCWKKLRRGTLSSRW